MHLVAKPPLKLVVENPLTYSERAEAQFMPTIASGSLLESIRGELPNQDGPDLLMFIVQSNPAQYATFLGKLIAGSSYKAACLAVGFNPRTLYSWLEIGASDLMEQCDTWCGRLLLDCQRAMAMSVSDAEERVHAERPEKWLSSGPAKQFHKGQFWQDSPSSSQESISGPEENPIDPQPAIEVEEDTKLIEQGRQDLAEAVKVLEDHEIITKPEFVEQIRRQFRLPKPNEKDTS